MDVKNTGMKIILVIAGIGALLLVVAGFSSLYKGRLQKEDAQKTGDIEPVAFAEEYYSDEIDYLGDGEKTKEAMQHMWELTGIQPYLLIRSYDKLLTSEEQMDEWAYHYFVNNYGADKNGCLVVYFPNEDSEKPGYVEVVVGKSLGEDAQVVADGKFGEELNKNRDKITDKDTLFAKAFSETARRLKKVLK